MTAFDSIIQAIGKKPYFQDDACVIYHAGNRDILPLIPDKSVDLVLTDPPYKETDIGEDYYEWFKNWVGQLTYRDYFVSFNNASRLYDILQILGKPYRMMIWSKGIVKYAWRFEPILIYASETATYKANRYIHSDHLPYQPLHKGQSCHQYEKPIKLMRTIISYFKESEIILEPFLGSGTTLVAAKLLGKKGIGIEIEEKYCEIAAKRLSQSVMRLDN